MPMTDAQREQINKNFLLEAARYQLDSPLFRAMALASSTDQDILELVSQARPGQSQSLLLFGVVHYLLLKSPQERLAGYFGSLTEQPGPVAKAFPAFKEFCLERRAEIAELLSWRTVNTNLAEKTVCLVPALRYIENLAGGPLTLLELCCSAGLNMLFDEYHYDYGEAGSTGVLNSPVQLKCRLIGSAQPPVGAMPRIAHRVGVDLVKMDLSDPNEHLWMQAVLFPEWRTERDRLKAALSIRDQRDLRIIEGDALEIVGPLLEELPGHLCILMSYCRGHWSTTALTELHEVLRRGSQHRDIHRLDVDPPDTESPQRARTRLLRLAQAGVPLLKKRSAFDMDHTWYSGGKARPQRLGEGDIFGEWLDWCITEGEAPSISDAKAQLSK